MEGKMSAKNVEVGEFYHCGEFVIKITRINGAEILGTLIENSGRLQCQSIVDPNNLGLKVIDKIEQESYEAIISQIDI